MKNLLLYASIAVLSFTFGCKDNTAVFVNVSENRDAKKALQGIWVDEELEDVAFKIEGDTVFYADSVSQPAYFMIKADTMLLGDNSVKYPIVKLTDNVFQFKNQSGDVVRLVRSVNPDDKKAFIHEPPKAMTITKKLKTDTVVIYNKERYHCYVAVNPTTYKVIKSTYNDDGVKVDNVYYDNIIHISVFKGTDKIYSRDFNKAMYSRFLPAGFLPQAVLSNIEYNRVDAKGFHFNAILCIPDGVSCYMLDTRITFDGAMSMELIEY